MNSDKQLALGILVVFIGSLLLAWSILTDAVVLTVFDGHLASITREGSEFKSMYNASSGMIHYTRDSKRKTGFRANPRVHSWVSWEDGVHVLYCKVAFVNPNFVILLLTNGVSEVMIGGDRPAVRISSIARNDEGVVTICVQNFGGRDEVLSKVYVNGMLNTPVTPLPIALYRTETATIVLSGTYTESQVKVKVETAAGTFMEYAKTFAD